MAAVAALLAVMGQLVLILESFCSKADMGLSFRNNDSHRFRMGARFCKMGLSKGITAIMIRWEMLNKWHNACNRRFIASLCHSLFRVGVILL